jgi:hypothetical protein
MQRNEPNQGHCWGHISTIVMLDAIVLFVVFVFVIPSVAQLTSSPSWYVEPLWNFSVLQRVHLSVSFYFTLCDQFYLVSFYFLHEEVVNTGC